MASTHHPNQQSDTGIPPDNGKASKFLGRKEVYQNNDELFQDHFLEQYKIYVDMADRISSRRHHTNVFFLSLQTTVISFIGFSLISDKEVTYLRHGTIGLIVIAAMICFCVAWWWIIKSYRNLNTAKYKVIGKMEESLPSSPYWKEEWQALGEGKDPKKYLPLTRIEAGLPIIFGVLYFCIGAYFYFQ